MKQNLGSSLSLGAFPSPGQANYGDRGWSSERVPHPSGRNRRHISSSTPFYSGRALPSKWEDAERWICSPVLGYGSVAKSSQPHTQRRLKSKSGPIVPPGIADYSNCSPSVPVLDGGSLRNYMANSPFSTGVLMPNGVGVHYSGGSNGGQANLARLTSLPCWSDMASESSFPTSPDEKLDDMNDAENAVTRVISRRDMATQMSPEGSNHSSPTERSSSHPNIPPLVESPSDHSGKLEIREVQVDKRATVISRFKRRKALPDVDSFNQNPTEYRPSSWDISDVASDFSRLRREEAKITAWENLQKAKAEAAIRKLEMKLEKKRSSSLDKIFNKLRIAQMKAQEMRSSISVGHDRHIPKPSHKIIFFHKLALLSSFTTCFTCRGL